MEIEAKDISTIETKEVYDDILKKVRYDSTTGTYVFERRSIESGKLTCYEVVRGKKYKNPDGSIVYRYPSNDDWGQYGLTVSPNCYADRYIDFLCSTKDWSPANRHNFTLSLTKASTSSRF